MNKLILLLGMGICYPFVAVATSLPNNFSISSLQLYLNNEEAVYAYQIAPDKQSVTIQAFNAEQQMAKTITLPGNFKQEVLAFYHSLQQFTLIQKSKRGKFIQQSHQFYQLLFEPFEPLFQEGKAIFIVGTGVLQYLPFEVLLSKPDSASFSELDFLIKKHPLSYFLEFADIESALKTQKVAYPNNFLGFAPVFAPPASLSNSTYASNSRFSNITPSNLPDEVPPLPYSIQEIEEILPLFQNSGILMTHYEAQKSSLKQQLQQGYRYIHLATHSFADFEDEKNSGIICAGGPSACDPVYEILRTGEIEQLHIRTELVVLSSCQSGAGKLTPKGIHGIHRSFLKAGAKNVVFSLWKVKDQVCHQFMTQFYKAFTAGKSYSEALRLA